MILSSCLHRRNPTPHTLVNRERAKQQQRSSQQQQQRLRALRRCPLLDDLANSHASCLAKEQVLQHSVQSIAELQSKLCSQHVGENVQKGATVADMHQQAMNHPRHERANNTQRQNILSPNFCEFGVGTALGDDGLLYMVQLFR